ncbi:hypothetical protein SAMN05443287_10133 [Micromonospora phaseoli]|uniref:Adhesin n=1 Tax=Micromonospora phaseoli TaxID=1144548 RepID=A0A1H6R430_9ACTN|nr:hypothetical protein [Micromonospora phaseoli]PZW03291.1 hypothetical protein CLV64_10133 [Micromonospora phaseoli]GIJ78375.1 hypothetical protein Xph01_28070 [Micromonospora phaseoli]SEI50599.1 hypothetical protein SAMN05443287_10133 [Micromonospora phaseoli]
MENAQAAGGRRLWWWLGAAALAVVVVVVATWTWVTVRGDGRNGHVVTGATGDLREATFVLLDGADVVRLRTADLGDDAYRVSTPRDANVRPAVSLTDGSLLTSLRGTDRDGPAVVEVVLGESVRWHIRLSGGAKEQHLDLGSAQVGDVEFTAGANRIELTLPPPQGTQRTLLSGGASQVVVRLAGDAPVQVRAGGGAGSVTVDGTTHSGVAGGTTFTPPAWESATERYDIDATSGVSTLTVERIDAN